VHEEVRTCGLHHRRRTASLERSELGVDGALDLRDSLFLILLVGRFYVRLVAWVLLVGKRQRSKCLVYNLLLWEINAELVGMSKQCNIRRVLHYIHSFNCFIWSRIGHIFT
jgi:hypothetical protein